MKMTLHCDPADVTDLESAIEVLIGIKSSLRTDPQAEEPASESHKTASPPVEVSDPTALIRLRLTDEEKAEREAVNQLPWNNTVPMEVYVTAWGRISGMPVGAAIMRVLLDREGPGEPMWREDLAAAAGVSTKSLRGVTGPLAEACVKEGVRRGMPFTWTEGSYSVPPEAALRWNSARRLAGEVVTGPLLEGDRINE